MPWSIFLSLALLTPPGQSPAQRQVAQGPDLKAARQFENQLFVSDMTFAKKVSKGDTLVVHGEVHQLLSALNETVRLEIVANRVCRMDANGIETRSALSQPTVFSRTDPLLITLDRDVNAVAVSADGKWLATGDIVNNSAVLWDFASGKKIRTFQRDPADRSVCAIRQLRFSADGKWLVCASIDNTAPLWEVATGKLVRVFPGEKLKAGAPSEVSSASLSSDGKWLAMSNHFHHIVRICETASGEEVRKFTFSSYLFSVQLSSDGNRLVVVEINDAQAGSNLVHICDRATGKEIQKFAEDKVFIFCAALSKDGKWLATGDNANLVRLWNVETGKQTRIFKGHSNWVRTVAFTDDGKRLISHGNDRTIRVWDLADDKLSRVIERNVGSAWIAMSPDGKRLASYSAENPGLQTTAKVVHRCLVNPGEVDGFSATRRDASLQWIMVKLDAFRAATKKRDGNRDAVDAVLAEYLSWKNQLAGRSLQWSFVVESVEFEKGEARIRLRSAESPHADFVFGKAVQRAGPGNGP